MNQVTGAEYAEVEHAVGTTRQVLRDQLAQLRAERERLTALLEARESDLTHLRVLIEDLTYRDSVAQPVATRLSAHLKELSAKQRELEDAIQLLSDALVHLDSLISATSSLTNPDARRDAGSDVDPLEVAITGRTLQGQEAERSRLAREVHDGPAQVLANAIMGLEYCASLTEKRPDSVPTELQRLKAGLVDGLDEVRRFIFDLRPISLEYDGLRITLEGYAADFQDRVGISVTVNCPDVDSVITSEQRFVIFRVIQEAMQNCRKHARASKLDIVVEMLSGQVAVSITDNGKGFDIDHGPYRAGHHGLQGMYERAESIQGRLVLFSEPDYGTEVRMRFPLTSA